MKTLILAAIRCSLMFLVPSVTYAISAQWDLDPISGDWNTAPNWTPMGVPDGPADIATFGLSHTTDVSISADTEVNGITFTSAATNPYTITASLDFGKLTISGVGIVNNSGIAQNFVNNGGNFGGQISFTNNATAGSSTVFTNNRPGNPLGGSMFFFDTSSAGSATLINNSGSGFTVFHDSSTAGNATPLSTTEAQGSADNQALRNLPTRQARVRPRSQTKVALALAAASEALQASSIIQPQLPPRSSMTPV
jgi:hypothetical protein